MADWHRNLDQRQLIKGLINTGRETDKNNNPYSFYLPEYFNNPFSYGMQIMAKKIKIQFFC
jgi:hypothetical protein